MSELAVWMCFANSYSKKLKPSDKTLSNEVANLKPFKACRVPENGLHCNCFFCKHFRTFQNICAMEIY